MNKKLSRRDFLKLAGVTSAGLALSACGVKATESAIATLIPPTGTSLPTETLTPTLTSTPTLPLEQLPQTKQALADFVRAFQEAGVDTSSDQLLQKGLEIRTITGINEKQYEIAFVLVESTDLLGEDYPLMIRMAEGWERATYKNCATTKGLLIGTNFGDFLNTQDRNVPPEITLKSTELVNKNFNFITLQDPFHPSTITPNDHTYSFSIADKELGWVQDPSTRVRGQSLVYGYETQFIPWLKNFLASNPSKESVLDFVDKHVSKIVGKYKNTGKFEEWVMVNEVALEDPYYEVAGFDYVITAFKAARKADPNAYLIYNYSQKLSSDKFTQDSIKNLKAEGLVDGLGLQFHLDGSTNITEAGIQKVLQSYIDVGVSPQDICISEFDVNLYNVGGTSKERVQRKAYIYALVLKTCIEMGVKEFTFWEATFPNQFNWLEQNPEKNNYWHSSKADPTSFSYVDGIIVPNIAYYTSLRMITNAA
jgi:GH35 family endo-1,4-beta-xylanase